MDTDEVRLEGRKLAGRYLLEEEIAAGGMGAIWRARDEVLDRSVAVKILHDRLAKDEEVLDRFRLEAVAAARLSHPSVVRVFDTGVDDGVCFIVMEMFEGRTLAELSAERGPHEPAEAARVARSILHGLAHAHREGVVHRDVKPQNVLVDAAGLVKVTDFGIAKAAFAQNDLTTTGSLLGTARYRAPEQVSEGPVDARTDVYSTGVVLYELLTGRPPFEAETHIATATMRLTTDPVPPGALRPGIPRPLDAVVMKALARDPDERYQSADEMSAALDRAAPTPRPRPDAQPASAVSATPRPGGVRTWVVVPLVLLLLAVVTVGAYALLEGFDGGTQPDDGPSQARTTALEAEEAIDHDPFGDTGSENPEEAPLAVDGNRETAWTTERYDQADLGGLKPGVGLIVDLGDTADVAAVRVMSELPGWRFQLHAGDDIEGLEETTPLRSADGLDAFRATEADRIPLAETVEARYVLVWVTSLAASPDRYLAEISEIDVYSPGG